VSRAFAATVAASAIATLLAGSSAWSSTPPGAKDCVRKQSDRCPLVDEQRAGAAAPVESSQRKRFRLVPRRSTNRVRQLRHAQCDPCRRFWAATTSREAPPRRNRMVTGWEAAGIQRRRRQQGSRLRHQRGRWNSTRTRSVRAGFGTSVVVAARIDDRFHEREHKRGGRVHDPCRRQWPPTPDARPRGVVSVMVSRWESDPLPAVRLPRRGVWLRHLRHASGRLTAASTRAHTRRSRGWRPAYLLVAGWSEDRIPSISGAWNRQ